LRPHRCHTATERDRYESSKPKTYPLWDRVIRHSIRPDGHDGFLLPYHDYLAPTGDAAEDARRVILLDEIAVAVAPEHMGVFSYAAELAGHDAALLTLVRCLDAVRRIREHGIAAGPWERREEWLNQQMALAWKDRGAFPGLGPSLEALGMRLGTALVHEMVATGALSADENPWPKIDALLRGKLKRPRPVYDADLDAIQKTWSQLPDERRKLLELLSRFDLTPAQAARWFDHDARTRALGVRIEDAEILVNPYRISEADVAGDDDPAVGLGTVDRGLLPDATVAARHPVPAPSAVGAQLDARRVRAAIVAALRAAAATGDSLLSVTEMIERLPKVPDPPAAGWNGIGVATAASSGEKHCNDRQRHYCLGQLGIQRPHCFSP